MLKIQLKCEKILKTRETDLRNMALKNFKWFME